MRTMGKDTGMNENLAAMVRPLLDWYDVNRRTLPWRGTGDPYRVLVSEIMLQQTRVAAVIPYYLRWMEELPDVESLAGVSEERLMKLWQGLGYYNRARNLQKAARMVVESFSGRFPEEYEDLLRLPGVGRKTANLILGDVYGREGYVCDTHCIRITGLLGLTDGSKDPLKVEVQLRKCIPPEESSDFCHRMVHHGRAVCVARRPDCENCTLRPWCDHWNGPKKEAAGQ